MRLNNQSSLQSMKPHESNTNTSVHESEAILNLMSICNKYREQYYQSPFEVP